MAIDGPSIRHLDLQTRIPMPRHPVIGSRALALLALIAWSLPVQGQENAFCLDCHNDPDLEMSYPVQAFSQSVHGALACIDCHEDLAGITEDHGAVKPVVCAGCHEEQAALEAESLHGAALDRGDALAPRCQSCHGDHAILPAKHPLSAVAPTRIPSVCGKCHRDNAPVQVERHVADENVISNYTESIHGEALFKKGLIVAPSCISCHTAHHILPAGDPRSTIARTNIAQTCATCHAMIEEVHRKIIDGKLWETEVHRLPSCADCHQPHRIRKVYYEQGMSNRDCLGCHAKPELVARSDGRSLYVNTDEMQASIHSNVACAQCHSQVQASHERPCETITEKVNCGACHEDAQHLYERGIHGQLLARQEDHAPTCIDCHGTHQVRSRKDPASRTFPLRVPDLCAGCHRDGEQAALRNAGGPTNIILHYNDSVHGKGLRKGGLTVTAMCTDCHTAHMPLPSSDPSSSVHRANVASTCAKCHHGIAEQFLGSVHATAHPADGEKLPVCNDCHSAHSIARAEGDAFRMEIMDVCGKCHEHMAETYLDTFHGKVSQLGYAKTAKCQDCHGAHDILPSSDPRSSVGPRHILSTCQRCHPDASQKFTGYLSHATHHDQHKYPWLYYTFWGMTSLLVGTFTVFGLHTLLWLPTTLAMRRRHGRHPAALPGEKQFQRFEPAERVGHAILICCFLSLAVTGMTLRFAYAPWAQTVSRLLGGFESCGYIHRVAAAVMFLLFASHVFRLVVHKRREYGSWRNLLLGPNTMLFTKRDAIEFGQSLRWFLRLGPRPHYGRWTYWEKFDYFAVFWGVMVIGSTGLVLWFPEFFTRFLPGWSINVATIIHSDEALLAAGFIFTIHFFNTHVRAEKFPMDTVIFTGRMSLQELKHDKPEEYERLTASGELERHLVDPLPEPMVRRMRLFGWIAITVGVSVVVAIIYAMLASYI